MQFNIIAAESVWLPVFISYTYPCITHATLHLRHSVKFLVSNDQSLSIVTNNWHIKLKQLISKEQLNRENRIDYQQAYQLFEKLQDNIFDDEVLSFSKMTAFIKKMQSSAYAVLKVDKLSRFQRAWILLKASKNATVYFRKFVPMDRAHCTSCYWLVLLAVTFLDAEEEILVLAWALVTVEDRANWIWSLQKIAPYFIAL